MLDIAASQRFVMPLHTLLCTAASNPYPQQIAFVWVNLPMPTLSILLLSRLAICMKDEPVGFSATTTRRELRKVVLNILITLWLPYVGALLAIAWWEQEPFLTAVKEATILSLFWSGLVGGTSASVMLERLVRRNTLDIRLAIESAASVLTILLVVMLSLLFLVVGVSVTASNSDVHSTALAYLAP